MEFRQKGDNLRKDLFPDKPLGPCPRVWEPGNANTAPTLENRLVGRVGEEMGGGGGGGQKVLKRQVSHE